MQASKLLLITPGQCQTEHFIPVGDWHPSKAAKGFVREGFREFARGLFPERNEWHGWKGSSSATQPPTLRAVFRMVPDDYPISVTNLSQHEMPVWSNQYLNRTETI